MKLGLCLGAAQALLCMGLLRQDELIVVPAMPAKLLHLHQPPARQHLQQVHRLLMDLRSLAHLSRLHSSLSNLTTCVG